MVWGSVPDQPSEQAANFGDGERDQLPDWNQIPPFAALAAAAVTVRKAWASMLNVICAYQES